MYKVDHHTAVAKLHTAVNAELNTGEWALTEADLNYAPHGNVFIKFDLLVDAAMFATKIARRLHEQASASPRAQISQAGSALYATAVTLELEV